MKMHSRLFLATAAVAVAVAAQAQLKPSATNPGVAPKTAAPSAPPAPSTTTGSPTVSDPEKEGAGRLAAHAWLLLLDRRDWGTAWEASGAMFRQAVPLGSWMDNIPKVREQFGPLVEREPGNAIYKTSMPGRPDGHYVTIIFNGKFGKKPRVQEVVTTAREDDGRWRVTGYTFTER